MDFLKPPTDNLYKFLFVGGLLLIGLAIYGRINTTDSITTAFNEFSKASTDFNLAYTQTLVNRVPPDQLAAFVKDQADFQPIDLDVMSTLPATFTDSQMERLGVAEEQLLQFAVARPPSVIRHSFAAPEAQETQRKILGFATLDEYKKFSAAQTDDQLAAINASQITGINGALSGLAKVRAELVTLHSHLVDYRDKNSYLTAVKWIGWMTAALGVVFWYLRSQRYQDLIVREQGHTTTQN